MITKLEARKHIAKLAQMKNYPGRDDQKSAHNELVLALECADNEQIAARVIQGFVDAATPESLCPMPRTIREAIYAIQEPAWEPEKPAPVACPDCGDSGIVGGLIGGPAAEWCRCASSREAKLGNPQAVAEINETTRKLSLLFGKKATPRELLAQAARERKTLANVTEILRSLDGGVQ